jgi:tetratricopeptide (TPR) repeat protein
MKQILETMESPNSRGLGGSYAIAAIDARHALERKDWTQAAALNVRRTPVPFVDAITYFARALGAARSNMPDAARNDLDQLKRAAESLGNTSFWGTKVDIQRQVAEAWILFAEGKTNDALALMRLAADREDLTEKSGISPGPIAPARELLGEMLLAADLPGAALEEFKPAMNEEPGRFGALFGAAQAAERIGDMGLASSYYQTLLEICERADDEARDALMHARESIAGNE